MAMRFLARFLDEEEGTTTAEYAILLALIVGVCFAAVTHLGARTFHIFDVLQPPRPSP